jgi:hypothetical protein
MEYSIATTRTFPSEGPGGSFSGATACMLERGDVVAGSETKTFFLSGGTAGDPAKLLPMKP